MTQLFLGSNNLTELPPEIRKLTNLRWLNLGNNPIADSDLEHLKSLTSLGEIYLHQTKVTKAGVASLQKALPFCRIMSEPEFP